MKRHRQPRTDTTFRLLCLVIIICALAQITLVWNTRQPHALVGAASEVASRTLWYDPHHKAERDAMTHAGFLLEGASVTQARRHSLSASLASFSSPHGLTPEQAKDGWLLAPRKRLLLNGEGGGEVTGVFGGSLPWIVHYATPWFGDSVHKWTEEGRLHTCPREESSQHRHFCTIAFYSSSHAPLWSKADVVLYHHNSGPSERLVPPHTVDLNTFAHRPLHTLLYAENLIPHFSPNFTAKFDAQVGYRGGPTSLWRDDEYVYSAAVAAGGVGADRGGMTGSVTEATLLSQTWSTLFPGNSPLSTSRRFKRTPMPPPSSPPHSPRKRVATISWASTHCHSRSGREDLVAAIESVSGGGFAVDVWGPMVKVMGEVHTPCCLCAPWRHGGEAGERRYVKEEPPWTRQQRDLFPRYKFHLALENSQCTGYVTEKAYGALVNGVVPIVLSAPDVANHLPPGSFIDVTSFPSVAALVKHLEALDGDDAAYAAYQAWRTLPLGEWGVGKGGEFIRAIKDVVHWEEGRVGPTATAAAGSGGALNTSGPSTWYPCSICRALDELGGVEWKEGQEWDRREALIQAFHSRARRLASGGGGGGGESGKGKRLIKIPPLECSPTIIVGEDAQGTLTFPPLTPSSKQPPHHPTHLPWLLKAVAEREAEAKAIGLDESGVQWYDPPPKASESTPRK